MQNNIYVDTNIIVDICDAKRPSYHDSLQTVTLLLEDKDTKLFINSDTLSNLFYILSRHAKIESEEIIEKMRYITTIFTLVSPTMDDVSMALSLCADKTTAFRDYEDTMQYVCAKKVGATVILTNDKGFVSPDIKVK